jgi:MFS family permease
VPLFYIVQYGEEKGISQRLSFDLLAIANAGSAFGRIIPGYMADVAGRYNLMIPATALSGVFSLALWLNVHNTAGIVVFAAIYGFFSGAYISLNTPCVAQISRPEQIGTRVGMTYSIFSFP